MFDGAKGPYVALPDKPAIQNGKLQRGADGKAHYVALLKWRDRQTSDKFSASVIKLLLQKHPNALD